MQKTVSERISVLLATGFGLGFSPIAPGTVGTVLGFPLVFLAAGILDGYTFSQPGVYVYCLVLTLLAIPICHTAEAVMGKKDDGRIVADEYMTFPIGMIGLPMEPMWFGVAFLTNRFFDITKIPPAYQAQRLKGGVGIVIDDVIAALFSLAANHALLWMWIKFFA